MDTNWIHTGYTLDKYPWIFPGYFRDTFWIQSGYILDTNVINIRAYKMDIVTLVNTAPNGIIREFIFCISAKFSVAQMVNAYT